MLIRYLLIALCSFGFGVALMDQLKQPPKPQFWLRYSTPTMTDYSRAEIERMYKDTLKARK